MPLISVVVPIYGLEHTIEPLVERVKAALAPIPDDFEIILVDDRSPDDAWARIAAAAAADPRVVGLRFSRNFGQHYALSAGIAEARGDWVVVMDGDLQDPPEAIPDLYRAAVEGDHQIVFVAREERPDSWFNKTTSRAFYRFFRLMTGTHYDSERGNFSIISRQVVDDFLRFGEHLRFYGGVLHWLGYEAATLRVRQSERAEGKSSYTFRKRLLLASSIILAHSERPLYVIVGIGFAISAIAFIAAIALVIRAILDPISVPGWASLMATTTLLGGIQLVALGVVGIYVGKTFSEVKRRPLYVIERNTRREAIAALGDPADAALRSRSFPEAKPQGNATKRGALAASVTE